MQDFHQLITAIEQIHQQLQASAANAVNKALTIRNWLIGYYIIEFEQDGQDRAAYGTKLLKNLSDRLSHIKGLDERSLRRFRLFYTIYPQLEEEILTLVAPNLLTIGIRGTASPELQEPKWGTVSPELREATKNAHSESETSKKLQVPADKILSKLSYSHLELLLNIDEPMKRTWSVRELKRQINSLYFDRSGLSKSLDQLTKKVQQKISPQVPSDIIKNIYAFDFLDISSQPIVEEPDLETALLDHLQSFIIELGNGFCLEARQKRILIGETYYFIDLVFYHRILKCHVLLELKFGAFQHGDIGQLNTYLNYYKEEMSESTDNPPVGILMVAEKDNALVKYATAGMDENLFIQKYLIRLPSKNLLEQYISSELKKIR